MFFVRDILYEVLFIVFKIKYFYFEVCDEYFMCEKFCVSVVIYLFSNFEFIVFSILKMSFFVLYK